MRDTSEALKLDPEYQQALYLHSLALHLSGQDSEALKYAEKAQEVAKNDQKGNESDQKTEDLVKAIKKRLK